MACRIVWDASHSGTAAKLTSVYLAGPVDLILKLAWLVFLALVARMLVHRLINRVTVRAADAPLAHRLRPGSETNRRRLSRLRHPIRSRELEHAHADLSDTRKVMAQAAAAMWHERRWRKLMLEKPEVWGVQAITDTQVTMRVAAKTLPLRQYEVGRELRERVVSAIDLALLDLEVDPQPGRTAAQLAAVGEETRRPKSPRTTMRSRTGHAGGDDPISEEIEPKDQADLDRPPSP